MSEPSMDGYHAAMVTYTAAFGPPAGEPTVVLPDGTTKQGWKLDGAALQTGTEPQSTVLDRARAAMIRAMDALEADDDEGARRQAFEIIQEQFEGVTQADHERAERLVQTLKDQHPKYAGVAQDRAPGSGSETLRSNPEDGQGRAVPPASTSAEPPDVSHISDETGEWRSLTKPPRMSKITRSIVDGVEPPDLREQTSQIHDELHRLADRLRDTGWQPFQTRDAINMGIRRIADRVMALLNAAGAK